MSDEHEALTRLRILAPNGQHVAYLRQAATLASVGATEGQVRAFARRVAIGAEGDSSGDDRE